MNLTGSEKFNQADNDHNLILYRIKKNKTCFLAGYVGNTGNYTMLLN